MEKNELFRQALSQEIFSSYNEEDLFSIGVAIGNNPVVFKELYQAYLKNGARYENKPMLGAKIEVDFMRETDEIMIKRVETTFKLNSETFLSYLNMLNICFGEVYPMGSVVELDGETLTESYAKAMRIKPSEKPLMATITGRFIPIGESENHFTEYMASLWPYGASDELAPLFISKMMIKRVIHQGMIDEVEAEYVKKLRERLIAEDQRSMAFLTDKAVDVLLGVAFEDETESGE
ncbi:MAG: DUF4176 domain-containing protein [Defluviitaleaceae bacterium]|nr:DUF4176 domain-containing protein [Defluviitaleaceae bacterium]